MAIKRKLSLAVVMGIITILLIFGAFANVIGYMQFTDVIVEQYKESIINTADTANEVLKNSKLDEYLATGGQSEEYATSCEYLQKLCNAMDVTFIYVIKVDTTDYNHITYVFDTVNESSEYDGYEIGLVKETTNEEYREYYRQIYENGLESAVVVRDKKAETGSHITALVPVKDSHGNVQGITACEKNMDNLGHARSNYVNAILCTTIGLIFILGLLYLIYLKNKLIDPLKKITAETVRFADKKTKADMSLENKIKSYDELGTLAKSIDEMEKQTLDYFTNLAKITSEKQRVDAELNLATAIQINMLPNIFPAFPEYSEFNVYATMNPAKEVGGDFYDFFMLDDNRIAVVIADVSGKGVPAALVMAITKILIKTNAQSGLSLGEVFTTVNQILSEGNKESLFVTAWMGVLNLETGIITYVNAGHNPPLLKHADGDFEFIKSRPGFVLAGMEGIRYKEYEKKIDVGDRLFLYTDGVTEAVNVNEELYGEERLKAYLDTNKNTDSKELLDGLYENINEFAGDAEQFDDITMLVLDYNEKMLMNNTEKKFNASVDELDNVIRFVEEELEKHDCSPKSSMQIAVAVEEIFVNVSKYAYNNKTGNVSVRLSCENDSIKIRFADYGMPFNPLDRNDPDITLSAEEREIGGLGIFMVKKSMDEVEYEYKNGQNILTITKKLN